MGFHGMKTGYLLNIMMKKRGNVGKTPYVVVRGSRLFDDDVCQAAFRQTIGLLNNSLRSRLRE
jgi:hypothetical protein